MGAIYNYAMGQDNIAGISILSNNSNEWASMKSPLGKNDVYMKIYAALSDELSFYEWMDVAESDRGGEVKDMLRNMSSGKSSREIDLVAKDHAMMFIDFKRG